jgi:hypothetical protein
MVQSTRYMTVPKLQHMQLCPNCKVKNRWDKFSVVATRTFKNYKNQKMVRKTRPTMVLVGEAPSKRVDLSPKKRRMGGEDKE